MTADSTKELFAAEEVLELLRLFKHDNLNHYQVIMGFLQLGKWDKALSYVKSTIDEINQNGRIMLLGSPYLSVTLFKKQLHAQRKNIFFKFEFTDQFSEHGLIRDSFACYCEELVNLVEKIINVGLERKDVRLCFDRLEDRLILELAVRPCFKDQGERLFKAGELLLEKLDIKGSIKERYFDEECRLIITLPEKSEVE
ncbi:MAG: hypothetical protein GX088_02930 [Clostridia bacterium]|nr:hypothetical protein [Clostridia bacterium]